MATTRTRTVKSSGGDYSSLAAWEAGEQADLPVLDEIRQAECYNFVSNAQVTIDGWTTDSTRYIRIYTPTAERHTGVKGTGFRLQDGGTTTPALVINENFVRVEGVSVISGDANSPRLLTMGNSTDVKDLRISYCYFYQSHTGYTEVDLNPGANAVIRFWNNTIKRDAGSPNYDFILQSGTLYFYNNTVVGYAANYGGGAIIWRTGGTFIAKNNICDENGATGCTAWLGTFDAASDYNHSNDTSAPGTTTRESVTPTYVDLAGDDMKLASADTACKDYGTSLAADANLAFSDDIIGTSRPQGSAWDMGSSEVIVASAVTCIGSIMRGVSNGVLRGGR